MRAFRLNVSQQHTSTTEDEISNRLAVVQVRFDGLDHAENHLMLIVERLVVNLYFRGKKCHLEHRCAFHKKRRSAWHFILFG